MAENYFALSDTGRLRDNNEDAFIAEKLPSTLKLISAIKGVGPQKAAQYGADLITLIRSYQQEEQGTDAEQKSLPAATTKQATRTVGLQPNSLIRAKESSINNGRKRRCDRL